MTKYIDKASPILLVDAPGPGSEVSVRGAYIEGSAEFHVGGGGGAGKAVFQDLSVTKYIDKATPKLLVDAPGPGSEVSVRGAYIEGSAEFHVGGGGGAGKAVFQDLSVTKYIDKATPKLLVDAPGPGSEVSVRGAYIEGSAEFHVGGGGGAGKAVFQDLSVTKYIDKATPKLLVDAPGPGSEVSVRGAYIEGSAEFHVGGGGGAGKAVFQDLSVTKYIDKATPKLLVDAPGPGSEVSVRGAYIEGSAEFHVGGGGGAGKAVFQDLSVTKYIDKATPKLLVDAPGPGSEVSVRGAYIEGSAEFHVGGGGGAGKAVFQDLSVTKYIDKATPILLVDAPGPGSEVSVRGAYIEGSAEFHVGGGGGAGKAVFQDLSVTKYIDKATPKLLVNAPGPGSEVSVRGAYIEGSAEFHVGGGGGAGKANFQDLTFTKYIDKASPILLVDAPGAGSEVKMRRVVTEGLVRLLVGGEAAADGTAGESTSTRIAESRVGSLEIDGPGQASNSVIVNSSSFDGPVRIQLDGGNDRLRIVDSVFANEVLLDGGLGEDLLQLIGSRFEVPPILHNWEL